MINKEMLALGEKRSAIRELFEKGKVLKEKYGKENVYDFSLGNPSVEPPVEVKEAIKEVVDSYKPNYIHGYMLNPGYEEVRDAIAKNINK